MSRASPCRRGGRSHLCSALDLLGGRLGGGQRVVDALRAGYGLVEFGADRLNHFLAAGALTEGRRVGQDLLDRVVVVRAIGAIHYRGVLQGALPNGSAALLGALDIVRFGGDPRGERPRRVRGAGIRRDGPTPRAKHLLAAGDRRQLELARQWT